MCSHKRADVLHHAVHVRRDVLSRVDVGELVYESLRLCFEQRSVRTGHLTRPSGRELVHLQKVFPEALDLFFVFQVWK